MLLHDRPSTSTTTPITTRPTKPPLPKPSTGTLNLHSYLAPRSDLFLNDQSRSAIKQLMLDSHIMKKQYHEKRQLEARARQLKEAAISAILEKDRCIQELRGRLRDTLPPDCYQQNQEQCEQIQEIERVIEGLEMELEEIQGRFDEEREGKEAELENLSNQKEGIESLICQVRARTIIKEDRILQVQAMNEAIRNSLVVLNEEIRQVGEQLMKYIQASNRKLDRQPSSSSQSSTSSVQQQPSTLQKLSHISSNTPNTQALLLQSSQLKKSHLQLIKTLTAHYQKLINNQITQRKKRVKVSHIKCRPSIKCSVIQQQGSECSNSCEFVSLRQDLSGIINDEIEEPGEVIKGFSTPAELIQGETPTVSLEVETSIQIQQQQMGEEMVKEEKGNRKYWKVGVGAVVIGFILGVLAGKKET